MQGGYNQDTRYGLRPTLIIGLGGTGHEVLVRLKARYLDAYGEDVFGTIQLRSFDTADEAKLAYRADGSTAQLDRNTELINIGNVPTVNLLKSIDRHPTIKAWLPPNMPMRAITAGAQQVRPMGRLAFFHHFVNIQKVLQQSISSLSNVNQRGNIGETGSVVDTPGINIFIISSVCGGTGSGIFLDMAYYIRHLCGAQGLNENYCNVNGVLVLPQAFAAVMGDAIRANAHAALTELDYFTKHGNFEAHYPQGVDVDIDYRPFSICYLVDAVNEEGRMVAGIPELSPMIAEAVFLQTASQVGDANKSVFDNVKSLHGMDQDFPTAYSGFGTASLVFPAQLLIDCCAARYCTNLLNRHFLKSRSTNDVVSEQFSNIVAKVGLSENGLRDDLRKDSNGRTIRPRLNPDVLKGSNHSDVVRIALQQLQREEDRLNDDYQRQVELNLKNARERLRQVLLVEMRRVVNAPILGLDVALHLLERFDHEVSRLSGEIRKQVQTSDERIETLARQSDNTLETLKRATTSLIITRRAKVNSAIDDFVGHHDQRLNQQFTRTLLNGVLGILAFLNDDVIQEYTREVRTLRDKIQVTADRMSKYATELQRGKSRTTNPLTQEVTEGGDIEHYYQLYARELTAELERLFEEQGQLHSWSDRSYDQMYEKFLQFGRSVFAKIREENIERVIREKAKAEDPDARLARLRQDAVPFWNRDIVRMTNGSSSIETISVVGVPDRDDSIYNNPLPDEVVTSTYDNHQVTVLTTRHGLAIFALQQYEDYKRRYERYRALSVAPLHCFNILDEAEIKRLFALGQAFGYIVREFNRFHILPPSQHQSLQERRELGQGLNNALNAFRRNTAYQQEMKGLLDRYERRNSLTDIVGKINQYLETPQASAEDVRRLQQELFTAALAYRDEIQRDA